MTVKIDSTSDTPEQVTAALGKEAPKPALEKPAAPDTPAANVDDEKTTQEVVTEVTEKVEGDDAEKPEGEKKDGDPPPKKKGGFQKKIDKLTRRAQEAETEVAHWKKVAQAVTPTPETQPKKEVPAVAGKPVAESFETHAEYIEALADWKVEQRFAAADKKKAEDAAMSAHAAKVKSWETRKVAAQAAHDDFQDAMDTNIELTPAMSETLLESENGAELAYYLGKHPEEAARIAKLAPLAAVREMGKLEARLEKPKEEDTPEKVAAASVKPKPVAPVGGRATPTASKKPEDMTYQEFKKWREKQLAEARS